MRKGNFVKRVRPWVIAFLFAFWASRFQRIEAVAALFAGRLLKWIVEISIDFSFAHGSILIEN